MPTSYPVELSQASHVSPFMTKALTHLLIIYSQATLSFIAVQGKIITATASNTVRFIRGYGKELSKISSVTVSLIRTGIFDLFAVTAGNPSFRRAFTLPSRIGIAVSVSVADFLIEKGFILLATSAVSISLIKQVGKTITKVAGAATATLARSRLATLLATTIGVCTITRGKAYAMVFYIYSIAVPTIKRTTSKTLLVASSVTNSLSRVLAILKTLSASSSVTYTFIKQRTITLLVTSAASLGKTRVVSYTFLATTTATSKLTKKMFISMSAVSSKVVKLLRTWGLFEGDC